MCPFGFFIKICEWKTHRPGRAGTLMCGWEDKHRSHIAHSESAETEGKQKQRGDLRCMAGAVQAEKKGWVISVCVVVGGGSGRGVSHFPAVNRRPENSIPKATLAPLHAWADFFGLREACHCGPNYLVYFYNKPLICEVSRGSLFLSTKEPNIHKGDWKSVRVVG